MAGKGIEEILLGDKRSREKDQAESPDGEELGPCASRTSPKGWVGLYVFNGTEDTRAFQYQHLGFENFAADGTSFVFEFNVPEKWKMVVTGRNLWRIFLGIHHHKLEWIKKAERDFASDGEPIITGIVIEMIKEER